MKKPLLALALVAGLILFVENATAQNTPPPFEQFTFTITGLPSMGSSTGTLTGLLTLNSTDTAATDVLITSVPNDIIVSQMDFYTNTRIRGNSFSVDSDGNMLSYWYVANDFNYNYFRLDLPDQQSGYQPRFGSSTNSIQSTFVTFTPVNTVPEPSTYALFGLGAIGMLMVMRRKKTV